MSEIVVSVILLTYNHARYIEQAARSILAQNVDHLPGPIEIIVGEDYSNDETPEILRRLDQEFPGRMTLLLRPKNLGLSQNLEDCWLRCRGRYIAILEGDDFWTDSNKLLKVVNFLDDHPGYCGCWHAYYLESTVASAASGVQPNTVPKAAFEVEDLLKYSEIRSYSLVCYRRGLVSCFPVGHRRIASGDLLLNLLHAMHGPFGFLPDVMATYRIHPQGMIFTMGGTRINEVLNVLFQFDYESKRRYHEQVSEAFDYHLKNLSQEIAGARKIAMRYHALRLDKVAAWLNWISSGFRRK